MPSTAQKVHLICSIHAMGGMGCQPCKSERDSFVAGSSSSASMHTQTIFISCRSYLPEIVARAELPRAEGAGRKHDSDAR